MWDIMAQIQDIPDNLGWVASGNPTLLVTITVGHV